MVFSDPAWGLTTFVKEPTYQVLILGVVPAELVTGFGFLFQTSSDFPNHRSR